MKFQKSEVLTKMLRLTLMLFLGGCVSAQWGGGGGGGRGGGGHGGFFSKMLENLPAPIRAQAQAIHSNPNLDWSAKREQMHKLFETLPADQRPVPPFMKNLSPEIRAKFEQIRNNKNLSRDQRRSEMHRLFQTLPADQRPQFPMQRFTEKLPPNLQAEVKALHESNLSFPERMARFKSIMERAPPEIRAQMPFGRGRGGGGGFGGGFGGGSRQFGGMGGGGGSDGFQRRLL